MQYRYALVKPEPFTQFMGGRLFKFDAFVIVQETSHVYEIKQGRSGTACPKEMLIELTDNIPLTDKRWHKWNAQSNKLLISARIYEGIHAEAHAALLRLMYLNNIESLTIEP